MSSNACYYKFWSFGQKRPLLAHGLQKFSAASGTPIKKVLNHKHFLLNLKVPCGLDNKRNLYAG